MKGLIFTYSLTFFGAVGGLISPFSGLLVYICFAIVRPEFMWRFSLGTEGKYSFIVGACMAVGWAVHGFGRWDLGRAWGIIMPLILYWLWMVLCAFMADNQEKAWRQVDLYAKILLPVLVGITTIREMSQIKLLVWVILLSIGYVAFEMNLYYYSGLNIAAEDGFGGADNNCLAIAMVTGVGLAFFLGMGTPQWSLRLVALGAAGLMAHVIFFSFSRGGMLALGLTGLMCFILIPKRPAYYVLFAVAALVAFRMAGPGVRDRFFSSFEKSESGTHEASAQSRLDLWTDALDATAKHPVFGVGPDNWGDLAAEYGWPRGKEVHSLWVQNAAELGVPGLLLLGSFFVVALWRLWPIAREKVAVDDPWKCDLARMVIASLFGFVVSAQFVSIKFLESPYYITLAGAAMLMLSDRGAPSRPPSYNHSVR